MTRHLYIYLLFIVLWPLQGQALAQEKYLDVFVTDTKRIAVSGISITCTQGCSTELVSQGRARIAVPSQTRPNDIIALRLVRRSPRNPEWLIVSPPDGMVMVPAFDNLSITSVSVMVTVKGDRQTLSSDKAIQAIVEKALRRTQILDGQVSEREFALALKMQAMAYGLTPEEVVRAIQAWAARAKDPYDKGLAALLDSRYADATELLTLSYNIRKANVAEFVDAAYFLGRSLWLQGRYKDSVEKLQEVVVFRKDDSVVLNMLGLGLSYAGKYSEAEAIYRRALAIDEQEYGKGSPSTAIVLNNLGIACRLQGKFEEAEKLSSEALAINRKELGDEAPLTANSLNSLAQLFRDQGKYDKAEPLYKEALHIREKKLGKDHPDTAVTIDNLGLLYSMQGKYEEAEPLLKYALSVKEKTLGFDHPVTANSYRNLGNLYSNQSRYAEAASMLEKALAIREKELGGENPAIGASLNDIGVVYHRQGKYPEAEQRYKRSLDICAKVGPDHCPMTFRNLAKLYTAQGRYAEAEPLFQRALAIYEKGTDEPYARIAFVLESYAELLRKTNREDEANALEIRAKEIRAKK